MLAEIEKFSIPVFHISIKSSSYSISSIINSISSNISSNISASSSSCSNIKSLTS